MPIPMLLALAAVLPLQDAKAEQPLELARAVPQDALFFVQATRLDALRSEYEESAWYAFYKDDEMKGLRDTIEKLFDLAEENASEKGGKGLVEELGVDPWAFLESVHGSIAAFGLARAGHDEPSIGILIEPGADRGKFEEQLTALIEKQKSTLTSSPAEYAGIELTLYEEKEGSEADEEEGEDDSGVSHSATFDAGAWVGMLAGTSREEVLELTHGMIDRMSGKDPATGFAGSEALASARASVSAPGRIEAFVDITKAMSLARESSPPDEEKDRALQALALDDLRWAYATADVGRGERLGAELAIRLPDSGYLREWFGCLGPFPREMAALAPRSSTTVTLAQVDVWGIWQSAWKLAAELDPEGTEQARAQMTAMLQQFGGLDIEKGFVSQLDGRFLSFNVPVPAEEWRAAMGGAFGDETPEGKGPTSGSAFVIGLREPQGVASFVKTLLTAVGIYAQVETEEFQGTTIHRLKSGGDAGVEWAFTKRGGVVSQFPTAMRAALRMEGAEAKDSALEVESFKPLYGAHADAAILGLASTAESLKSGLSVLEMMGPFIGMGMMTGYREAGGEGELPNPFEHLPGPGAIDRHFRGTIVQAVTRKSGVLHVLISSQ